MGYARVVALSFSRHLRWFLVAGLAVTVLVALTWDRLALGVAMALSESRPALLRDAEWGKPAPAFHQLFKDGTPEADLLHWLDANHFEIDGRVPSASRRIRSLPCNERVRVSWAATNGTIRDSRAVVSEAGCL
jgi:hypothetical protein